MTQRLQPQDAFGQMLFGDARQVRPDFLNPRANNERLLPTIGEFRLMFIGYCIGRRAEFDEKAQGGIFGLPVLPGMNACSPPGLKLGHPGLMLGELDRNLNLLVIRNSALK